MEQTQTTTDELITSLYKFVKEEADFARTKFKVLDNLVIKVDRIDERLANLEVKVDRIEERLIRVENRLTIVEEKVDKLDIRLTKVETKLDQVDTRLIRVESTIDRIDGNSTSHEGRLIALEDSMKFVKENSALIKPSSNSYLDF